MNAKDTIKAIKDCKTVAEVQVILDEENGLEKPRSTVTNAGAEMIKDLNAPKEDNSQPSSDAKATPSADDGLKHQDFYNKIPFSCRKDNVISFAKEYFGKNFKSADTEPGTTTVKITLKDGDVLNARGI